MAYHGFSDVEDVAQALFVRALASSAYSAFLAHHLATDARAFVSVALGRTTFAFTIAFTFRSGHPQSTQMSIISLSGLVSPLTF